MGLLLSVLIACVGVIELVSFCANVQRNLKSLPISTDLSAVRAGYIQELYGVRRRIKSDLENVQREVSTFTAPLAINRSVPTFRLNSHEDIEIEYSEDVVGRSRSCSPRSVLGTEKEKSRQCKIPQAPRQFVVAEEPKGIKKSKCQSSIPEFLIQEENSHETSSDHPQYALRGHERRSGSPIPLPSEFILTEAELSVSKNSQQLFHANDASYRRSPSPYPPLDLPQPSRNSICNELVDDPSVNVFEADEESYKSRSPSPNILDQDLNSNFDSTSYWKNKALIVPHKKSKSRSSSPVGDKKHKSTSLNRSSEANDTRSKSECQNSSSLTHQAVVSDVTTTKFNDQIRDHSSVFEEQTATFDNNNYLNNLDGVNKQTMIKQSCSSRQSIKRKTTIIRDSEIASTSKLPNTSKPESSLVKATEKLGGVSGLYEDTTNEVSNDTAENKTPEPFWVKH